jgi:ATP-dependent HslUV protease ATP-binding subunit HslU
MGSGSTAAARADVHRQALAENANIVADRSRAGEDSIDIPGGQMGMININEMLGKAMGQRTKPRKLLVGQAYDILIAQESDNLLDMDQVQQEALRAVENDGIVFLDEIDKICARSEGGRIGADVSREGVQRDLLPIVEGSAVTTKYGVVKTDHVLFIAAGAFHVAKPKDMIPELQGRFPIRVELEDLTKDDFVRILSEPHNSLSRQYTALMKTENVEVTFSPDAIEALADYAFRVNQSTQNIGARRLHTIMERLLEDLSFEAPDMRRARVVVNAEYVTERLQKFVGDEDLSRFIL